VSRIITESGGAVGCQLAVLRTFGGSVKLIDADHVDHALQLASGAPEEEIPFAILVGGDVVRVAREGVFSPTPHVNDIQWAVGLIRKGGRFSRAAP
jgi:hypothetical protein